jgi:hypothetical protein
MAGRQRQDEVIGVKSLHRGGSGEDRAGNSREVTVRDHLPTGQSAMVAPRSALRENVSNSRPSPRCIMVTASG